MGFELKILSLGPTLLVMTVYLASSLESHFQHVVMTSS